MTFLDTLIFKRSVFPDYPGILYRFMARRKSLEFGEILLMNNINPKDPEEMKNLKREKSFAPKL
jgi:hypothetical protein